MRVLSIGLVLAGVLIAGGECVVSSALDELRQSRAALEQTRQAVEGLRREVKRVGDSLDGSGYLPPPEYRQKED